MERFITEYANYKKRNIQNNNLMGSVLEMDGIHMSNGTKALNIIDKALKLKKSGLITVEETMQMITNPFEYEN